MNPFDFVNAINNKKKEDIIRNSENPVLAEKLYNPFFTNKAFSYYKDTILIANEINQYPHADKILQNDYYLNTIRPAKRYEKWHKRQQDGDIEVVQQHYKVSYDKAVQILNVLNKQQIDLIRKRTIKGGIND